VSLKAQNISVHKIQTDPRSVVHSTSVSGVLSLAMQHHVLLHVESSAGQDGFVVLRSQSGVIHAVGKAPPLSPSQVQWLSAARQ